MLTRRDKWYAVAFCLGVAAALIASDQIHRSEVRSFESLLATRSWDKAQQRLEKISGQAFCYNLVGRRDGYLVNLELHNTLARLYNRTVALNPGPGRYTEPPMEVGWVTGADLNGIVMLAHINPWQDCYQRYGIHQL